MHAADRFADDWHDLLSQCKEDLSDVVRMIFRPCIVFSSRKIVYYRGTYAHTNPGFNSVGSLSRRVVSPLMTRK